MALNGERGRGKEGRGGKRINQNVNGLVGNRIG